MACQAASDDGAAREWASQRLAPSICLHASVRYAALCHMGPAIVVTERLRVVGRGKRVASEEAMSEPTAHPKKLALSLRDPLTFGNSLRFPLQSPESRRDLLIGGLWLFVPVVGWLLNMGHRVRVVHRMQNGAYPWPAWGAPLELLKHGALTFLGMMLYGFPGVTLMGVGAWFRIVPVGVAGAVLWLAAVVAIPGYMSHYCKAYDPREIFDPVRALGRVRQGGIAYWKAWALVVPIMLLSFAGLLFFGVGFNFTSVWFWQSAAFSFGTVFTQTFRLDERAYHVSS